MRPRIAVVGATGVVGETLLRVLEERGFGGEIGRFASHTRDGVLATSDESLAPYDVVFFAGSEEASERFAPAILQRGGVVIDNSATFRLHEGIPLVVPEVNAAAMRPEHRLLPVGNCTAIILCLALAPVRDAAGLASVAVATYQAVSGAGRDALEAFERGEGAIVRNAVPQIGAFGADGSTVEERKIAEETRKVLGIPGLPIDATSVRVPVRTAHSEAVFFETARDATLDELAAALGHAPGVVYHREGIVTPREVEGTDDVHVARLRRGARERSFQMWVVGDQLRKGAATNAVQLLERRLQLAESQAR